MSIATEMRAELYPWLTGDLGLYSDAICSMWAQLEQYIDDDPYGDGSGGWSNLLDVDRCPFEALPYLAQWNGEQIRSGMTDGQARAEITHGPNNIRGTPAGIARAAQRSLTGTGSVQILERQNSDGSSDPQGDHFTVITFTSETPNSAQVWKDLLTAIPADMVCNYVTAVGALCTNIKTSYATCAAVKAAFPTCNALLGYRTGSNVWTITS